MNYIVELLATVRFPDVTLVLVIVVHRRPLLAITIATRLPHRRCYRRDGQAGDEVDKESRDAR